MTVWNVLWFLAALIGVILGWALVGVLLFWFAEWVRVRYEEPELVEQENVEETP